MENHASVTGWQNLFISYKCFQLSAAVAIATFEIYDWNFSGYLILICSFSLCKTFFKSELFSSLPKVGHVIKSCKYPKIDQNKTQTRSKDTVQNLGNERSYIYKDPHQDSGQKSISYSRYPKKCFTQTHRDLYGDAMLVHTGMSSNMTDGNQQKHLFLSFATKAWIYSSRHS